MIPPPSLELAPIAKIDPSDEKDTDGEVPMLDPEFDDEEMGEDVELEAPAEDKFTNDLDPAQKQ